MFTDLDGSGGDALPDLHILFVLSPHYTWEHDQFEHEQHAAESLDIPFVVVDIHLLAQEAFDVALRALPPGSGRRWLYRGYILPIDIYEALYDAIRDRGDILVVPPGAVEEASMIPHYLPAIEDCTPETRWIDGTDPTAAWAAACELGPPPWIIKDHIKSAKEAWEEACYVPEGADRAEFDAICRGLIDHRGDQFVGGIVIRRYVPLTPCYITDPGLLAFDEYRLFFWEGALLCWAPYLDASPPDFLPPFDPAAWHFLGDRIDSPFFVADVARQNDGAWTVIEINDGGYAAMPACLDPRTFYATLLEQL
ncbi:MAG: ATP-grasp domain-containing protein [Myxococcota bacterium]